MKKILMICLLILILAGCKNNDITPIEPINYELYNLDFNYSLKSNKDLTILNKEQIKNKFEIKDKNDNIISEHILETKDFYNLSKEYLMSLTASKHEYKLYIGTQVFDLTITIHNKADAYLMQESLLESNMSGDLYIYFDLFNSKIDNVSVDKNRPFENNDLTIDGDKIIIKRSYIEKSYNSLKDTDQMAFVVSIKDGSNIKTNIIILKIIK